MGKKSGVRDANGIRMLKGSELGKIVWTFDREGHPELGLWVVRSLGRNMATLTCLNDGVVIRFFDVASAKAEARLRLLGFSGEEIDRMGDGVSILPTEVDSVGEWDSWLRSEHETD